MKGRCNHGFVLGKCFDRHCPHWDGFKSDADSARVGRRDQLVAAKLRPEVLPPGQFRCVGCTKVKSVGDFQADDHCKRGHQKRCKVCEHGRDISAGGDLMTRAG